MISPPLPAVAAPVAIVRDPVVPEDEVPEANLRAPLTPFVPAFDVTRRIAPLEVAVPEPAVREREPPVLEAVVKPAFSETAPPSPVSPVPTLTMTSPLLPFVAEPVKSCK
jgi:hypothetical protein